MDADWQAIRSLAIRVRGEPRPTGRDPHTGQVYFIARRGALVLRTPSLPPVRQILDGVQMVAALR